MNKKKSLVEVYPELQKYFVDYDNIGFSGTPFMLFGLPTRKSDVRELVKKTKDYKIVLAQTDKKYRIPYGARGRIVQIFIDTQIIKNQSGAIGLGKSLSEFTEILHYTKGRATKSIVEQTLNFANLYIRIEPITPTDTDTRVHTLTTDGYRIAHDYKNPNQMNLEENVLHMNKNYTKFIMKHAAPLDMKIIRKFKNNPTALDFIRYLAYRNNGLKKGLSFPEERLFEHIGATTKHKYRTRTRLNNNLIEFKKYWKVNAGFKDKHFYLNPSEPMIPPKKLK